MTKAGFGEHLKREREMRAVSLNEICAATRISVRFLEALEGEEWDKLPGGIFNRGFVRAVARFLGLDEEGFVAEYALAIEEHGSPQPPAWTNQPAQPKPSTVPWLALICVAVALALAGVGWLGWRWHVLRRAQRNSSQGVLLAPHGAADSPALSPPPPAVVGDAPATDASSASVESDTTVPSGSLQLKIEAGVATTLTISADGQQAFSGDIIAGQTRTFSAQNTFEVSAQDAGALLLQLNGRTLAPMGPPGRPGKVTLTRRDAAAGGAD